MSDLGTSSVGYWQQSWQRPVEAGRARRGVAAVGTAGILFACAFVLSAVAVVFGALDDLADQDDARRGEHVFKIGQTAHTDGFDVTVHTVQDPYEPANSWEMPPVGTRFVAVELTATNTASGSNLRAAPLGTEVLDAKDRAWRASPLAGLVALPHLGGAVPSGESRRGWVIFAVAEDATALRMRIRGNLGSDGSIFQL